MSTNYNRIRVADLEKNQPNKILVTNEKGELEFHDANNLQTEKYNALDCITEGKALDARQGKVLKDMIDSNTVNLANDPETQINDTVQEDKKVVSRLKLFNWWQWIKNSPLKWKNTISASPATKPDELVTLGQLNESTPTFDEVLTAGCVAYNKGIYLDESDNEYRSYFSSRGFSAGHGLAMAGITSTHGIQFNTHGSFIGCTFLSEEKATEINKIELPNKSGIVALKNDFVKTAAGTTANPPLIIPNGTLTTTPQEGAIERDQNGILWETHNGERSKLAGSNDVDKFLAVTWKSLITQTAFLNSTINSTDTKTVLLPANALGSSDYANLLFKTFDKYHIRNSSYGTLTPPTSVTFEVFLKGNDCTFGGNQYVKLYSSKRTDIQTNQSIRNCEIALHTNLATINDNPVSSSLSFSSLAYDNYGNVSEENYSQYYLQALNGNYIKFSNASISLEYRVSCEFADPTNIKLNNANCRSIFDNFSSLFLKL